MQERQEHNCLCMFYILFVLISHQTRSLQRRNKVSPWKTTLQGVYSSFSRCHSFPCVIGLGSNVSQRVWTQNFPFCLVGAMLSRFLVKRIAFASRPTLLLFMISTVFAWRKNFLQNFTPPQINRDQPQPLPNP